MNMQANQSPPRRRTLGAIGLLALALAMGPVTDGNAQSSGGFLGVTLQDMDEELRSSYGLHRPDGVLVSEVQAEGPADKAGVQRGDILLRVAGATVSNSSDVIEKVRGMTPGETAIVTVWRGNRELTFRVVLSERPSSRSRGAWIERDGGDDDDGRHVYEWESEDGKMHAFKWGDGADFEFYGIPMPDLENLRDNVNVIVGSRARLGVRTEDLNEQLGAYFQVPDGQGVLVVEVLDDTPAQKAGIVAGDVIVSVDGDRVATTAELAGELREKEDGPVRVEVVRRGSRQTLTAQLEKRDLERRWSARAPRAYRHSPKGTMRIAPVPVPDRREMERDMNELRREMRELEREMEELRRELQRDGG